MSDTVQRKPTRVCKIDLRQMNISQYLNVTQAKSNKSNVLIHVLIEMALRMR